MALQRRFSSASTDQDYVQLLEEVIIQIQKLVSDERLSLIIPATSQTIPTLGTPQPSQRSTRRTQTPLQFVQEEPDTEAEPELRWETHLRRLVDSTPKASNWDQTIVNLGINPSMNDAIIHSLMYSGAPGAYLVPPQNLNLLDHVAWYATNITQQPRMVTSFQKFLLACVCVVLEAEGFPEASLNRIMRINISSAQDTTLRKIRKGVLVVTSVISQLITSGWGSRASLLPLIWGKDPPYFLRLSDDLRCENLLVEALSAPEYAVLIPEETILPISIPLVVQQILANQIDLRRISLALRMFLTDPGLSPGAVIPVHA